MDQNQRNTAAEAVAIGLIRDAHEGMPSGEVIERILDACYAVHSEPTKADVDAVGDLALLIMLATREYALDQARRWAMIRDGIH